MTLTPDMAAWVDKWAAQLPALTPEKADTAARILSRAPQASTTHARKAA